MPFNLPQSFEVNLPDLQEFANNAIGFEPNPDLPRISDSQREQDALTYREQMNAAANLKDSIQVANKYVDAGISATKLGKSLITYQIGLQDIRTEKVNFQKSVLRTDLAFTELSELNLKLGYQTAFLPVLEQEYQHKLTEAQSKADLAQRKAMAHQFETEMKYPTIDIQSRIAA
ncbi:hypothetical protein [Phormidesmis priestleyi]|uniref:hypothetical protein n=1 Tax=Phormidesmis priestleyi TaxID=268141 RepID=UPI00083B3593|nr:hypothetical protein [Phormidesmis priestleyi]